MAGPPRFTSMPSMGNGFRMNFGGPPQPLIGMPMRPPPTTLAPAAGGGGPPKNSQVTTVFVGNISEKADNEFVKQMLEMCGTVVAWKRMAGVSGKLQGFGFCDFEEPEDTLRALRVLNEFQLGDKKLIVKVEQKHRDQLKAFAEKEAGQPAKPNSEELPASEKALRKDENVRLKILEMIEKDFPELVKFEDGEVEDKEKDSKLKDAKKAGDDSKDRKDRRSKRSRSRSGSRSRSPARRGRRSRSPRNKRRRRSSRSSSRSSSDSRSSRSSSRSSSYDSRDRKKRSRRSRSASRATYASDDSEDAREKRAIKRQIKEKEMAYAARLREWETREKKMSKKYEKDESREKNRKLDVNKEAKKLKAFLEDYDDEKDDPKYYKSSSLFARRRDFEREKGADERDRLMEQAEIEELKRQIVEESKAKAIKQEEMETREVEEEARRRHEQKEAAARAKHQRDGSGSPNPHQPLGQRRRANGDGGSSSSESGTEDDEEKAEDENDVVKEGQKWSTFAVGASDSPAVSGVTSSPAGGASASPAMASATRSPLITAAPIRLNTLKTGAASVFGGDEDDEVALVARKKLKPFEITQEERLKTMTSGEIKKLQKEIADTIPADKEALFEFAVKRDHLTKGDAMGRVKSWVAKKIKEYIGEEDQSLIQFICERVTSGVPPAQIQDDLAMIIDNEAAAFTIKLWRLVIYETECASRGLPQATAATR